MNQPKQELKTAPAPAPAPKPKPNPGKTIFPINYVRLFSAVKFNSNEINWITSETANLKLVMQDSGFTYLVIEHKNNPEMITYTPVQNIIFWK